MGEGPALLRSRHCTRFPSLSSAPTHGTARGRSRVLAAIRALRAGANHLQTAHHLSRVGALRDAKSQRTALRVSWGEGFSARTLSEVSCHHESAPRPGHDLPSCLGCCRLLPLPARPPLALSSLCGAGKHRADSVSSTPRAENRAKRCSDGPGPTFCRASLARSALRSSAAYSCTSCRPKSVQIRTRKRRHSMFSGKSR